MLPVECDPEELVLEEAVWNVPLNPPAEHTMAMWNYVDPEVIARKKKGEGREASGERCKKGPEKKRQSGGHGIEKGSESSVERTKTNKEAEDKTKEEKEGAGASPFRRFP